MVAPAYVSWSRNRRSLTVVAVACSLALAASGCARPVAVQAPSMSGQCEDVLASAPIRLLGELQRETSPADAAALAWGEPPIVLVCGLDFEVPMDAQVIEIDGVSWVTQLLDEGTVFTTLSATPRIQLRVPIDYRPEIDALIELSVPG